MKARRALLATGDLVTTHSDCWFSEEVADVEVEVDAGTLCDCCEQLIAAVRTVTEAEIAKDWPVIRARMREERRAGAC